MKRETAVKLSRSGYIVYVPARRNGRVIFQTVDGSETYTWEDEKLVPIAPRLGRATDRWKTVDPDCDIHKALVAATVTATAAAGNGETNGLTLLLQRAGTHNNGISAAVANMASLQYNDVRFRQSLDALIEHATALRSML